MRCSRSCVSTSVALCVTNAIKLMYSLILFCSAGRTSVPVVVSIGVVRACPLVRTYCSGLSAGVTGCVTSVCKDVSSKICLGTTGGTCSPVVGSILVPVVAVVMLNCSGLITYVTVFVAVVIVYVVCRTLGDAAIRALVPVLALICTVNVTVAMRNCSGLTTDITVGVTAVIVGVLCVSYVSAVVTVGVTAVVPSMLGCAVSSLTDKTYVPVSGLILAPCRTKCMCHCSLVSTVITLRIAVVGVLMGCLTGYCSTSRVGTLVPVVSSVGGVCA